MPHGTLAQVAQTYVTGYIFFDKMGKNDRPGILRNDLFSADEQTLVCLGRKYHLFICWYVTWQCQV